MTIHHTGWDRSFERKGEGRKAVVLAILIALAGSWFFRTYAHTGLYGDGPLFVELWRNGVLVQAHFLLLPLAQLWTWCAALFVDLARDEAIRAVSVASAAATCALTFWKGARLVAIGPALGAVLLLALAPSFRFFAGAVEVHALAGLTSAIAMILAHRSGTTRGRALLLTALGYMLACATHITLTLLGPALLMIHADAERRAGRAQSLREIAVAGGVLLAAAGLSLGLILLCEFLLRPAVFTEYSAIGQYIRAMQAWDEDIPRPAPGTIAILEILAPMGALGVVSLCGLPVLVRSAPRLALGLVLAAVAMGAVTLKVGAREYGAYMIPALPALAWFAAAGIEQLVRRRALMAWALLALAAVLQWGAIALWWREHTALGGWTVQDGDLALPWEGFLAGALSFASPLVWLSLAALLALGSGWVRGRGGDSGGRPRAARILATGALLLLGLLVWSGGERFRRRWPQLWGQELRDSCAAVRARLSERDLLLVWLPILEARWAVNQYYDRPWVDLSGLNTDLTAEQIAGWCADLELRMREVRRAGGEVVLLDDTVAGMVAEPVKYAPALAAIQRWVASGLVKRWSLGSPALQGGAKPNER